MNNEYAKNGYNGPKFTQDAPKEHAQGGIYSARNVSFQYQSSKVNVDHANTEGRYISA
jgi:hypothetical protein